MDKHILQHLYIFLNRQLRIQGEAIAFLMFQD